MDGPLIQTKQFGNIGQLAPGHIQTVDVAIHTIRRTTGNVGVTITLRNANDQLVAASVRTTLKIGLPDYTEDERALRFHEAPTWMQQAKFGIFIHWGVYAVPSWAPVGQAYAEWYWWQMNMGKATREYHENAFGTKFEYDDFLQLWKPTEFDANRLLELIDVSRARYYVFTTKHHDGIALWDTKVTSRSTVQLAPHRDFVKELDTVSKTAFPHLKRGLYYSLPEWYHPSYFDPSLGWRGPPRNAYTGERVPYTGSRPISDYVNELQVPQILELIDTFQPDILWCDIGGINNSTAWQGKFFDDGQQRDQQVSLNDRCGNHISDFSTIEYRAVNIPPPRFWEATRGIDPYSFGYNHATRPDQYASTTSLIVELVNVVTKGGNFLLNIGPDASGKVPDVMANCLREIGQWLDKVNPAIFNSEPYWVTTEDTLEPGQPLRFSQRRDGRAFYVFSLQRPIHRMVVKTVIPLRQQSVIRMMGSAIELRWEVHNNGRLIIVIPSGITNTLEHVWVFEVLL
ncbi:alpha-L-fucosidase-domain-containing protein [Radiomyces spectabilis]|uniref:alpha-L-fucosidase-domain-containing protein n=1 Tax=Radiomyces spectabilis TaxID=64574 RepID=UPI0022210BB6|nr:alpha-L-fucosidase-domain-containing protein [Radiomyces spectabilis]KAI8388687.1 alpha-L-fucosidase-domain-containing protein [Radiomyces spectabilis]